jgi:hypothetical protein
MMQIVAGWSWMMDGELMVVWYCVWSVSEWVYAYDADSGGVELDDGWRGSWAAQVLDAEELRLVDAMLARVHKLAAEAAARNVRLMIDAEHTYFQVTALLLPAWWLTVRMLDSFENE